eukprot:CAMPEP_0205802178 /NCGR_PEP_ID=MMETSP0205-20121125/4409_1 /ASSEMBLY_ACC=CAM_ASM_000278 /TAXON_ID=36767 /ORGANISM="Euplotes focardii, Strain TN1" /LENGTH=75 /DNA_ID=CAMNT_0053068151 /DNA_START=100 /DNA_END=327 /DNA_ORIENTATION=-
MNTIDKDSVSKIVRKAYETRKSEEDEENMELIEMIKETVDVIDAIISYKTTPGVTKEKLKMKSKEILRLPQFKIF